jgi:hypothetical protein
MLQSVVYGWIRRVSTTFVEKFFVYDFDSPIRRLIVENGLR